LQEHRIVLTAGPHSYRNCPVAVELPAPPEGPVEIYDPVADSALPAQVEGRRAHWILDRARPAETRELLIRPATEAPGSRVTVDNAPGDRVAVKTGGRPFTNYVYGPSVARPYLHPLIGPFGHPVTRGYPMESIPDETEDHPHHKSCWVAHGDVNGADNWSEGPEHATVVHQEFSALESGPVFATLRALNHWLDKPGAKVLEEEREYRFYNLPASGSAFDLRVTFRATEGDVRFGDTKEGGIASIRVATIMDVKAAGLIENAVGGVNEGETWGKRAHWCDYSGPVHGDVVGVAIFDTPGNFRFPTYWHVRDYGLMTANPFGLSHFLRQGNEPGPDGSHTLAAGQELTFRYRIYVHAGDACGGQVAAKYHHYVHPPKIEAAE